MENHCIVKDKDKMIVLIRMNVHGLIISVHSLQVAHLFKREIKMNVKHNQKDVHQMDTHV